MSTTARASALALMSALAACSSGADSSNRANDIVARHRPAIYVALDREGKCDREGNSFFACFGRESRVIYQRGVNDESQPLAQELRNASPAEEPVRSLVAATLGALDALESATEEVEECAAINPGTSLGRCDPSIAASAEAGLHLWNVLRQWDPYV